MKPERINILGSVYSIEYCNRPSDVDLFKRESLFGQTDYWTQTIRIYDNGRSIQDIWKTIIHEVLHIIGECMKLDILDKGGMKDERKHEELDMLAVALADTFFRNNLILLKADNQDTVVPMPRPRDKTFG